MKTKPRGPKKTFESERKIQERADRLRMIDRKLDNKRPARGAKGQSSGSSYADRGGDRRRSGGPRGGSGAPRGGRGARATRR